MQTSERDFVPSIPPGSVQNVETFDSPCDRKGSYNDLPRRKKGQTISRDSLDLVFVAGTTNPSWQHSEPQTCHLKESAIR